MSNFSTRRSDKGLQFTRSKSLTTQELVQASDEVKKMIFPIVQENEWKLRLGALRTWQPPAMHTLVVSPHPDDETLAAGGLIASLRSRGIPVTVAAVTDGENAYEDTPRIGPLRQREQTEALSLLGVDAAHIVRYRLPDSGLKDHEAALIRLLLDTVTEEMHIVAPWHGDFHPDHEVCGRAAQAVAKLKGLPLTSFFFWTWHRGTLDTIDDLELVSFPLAAWELNAKQAALLRHRSQLEHENGCPILPANLREPVNRPYEVYLPA